MVKNNLVALILLSFLFAGCSSTYSTPPYMVVMDAGSSGTRVYVYQIVDAGSSTQTPIVNKLASCKDPDPNCAQSTSGSDKGIAALAGQPQTNIDAYLAPMIAYAKKNVPDNQLSNIPIFLRATAGVRNLSPESAQTELMNLANTTLQNAGFRSMSSAQVLSGFAEGVYGWLNANSALNTLGLPSSQTYGIIEMGGASEQITFIPLDQPNTFPVSIAGQIYSLYSYSYNHLGANEASLQTNNDVDKTQLEGCGIGSAGLPANYTTCKNSWATILNQNFACVPLCGLEGQNQSTIPPSMNFKILGGTPGGISQSCQINPFTPDTIDTIGAQVCNAAPGTGPCTNYKGNPQYLCKLLALLSTELSGALPPALPFDGFGFTHNSTQVTPADADGNINGQKVTWTKGFVIGELIGLDKTKL